MTLKLNERYPGRANAPTVGYPQGSFKNRTAPGAQDGSYLERDWANDQLAFFASLLSAAGITANGNVDTVGACQTFDALNQLGVGKITQFSLTINGYIVMPASFKGVIIQWGTLPGIAGDRILTFPIAFPNGLFRMVHGGSASQPSGVTNYNAQWIRSSSNTGATFAANESQSIEWLAVGH